jgi:transposase
MAYDKSTRTKLRAKYVQGMALTTAAEACRVPYNTARNWKRSDAENGDDWDIAKNAKRMTKSGVEHMANEVLGELADQFLSTLQAIKDDKKMKANEKADILVRLMDGYNKAISAASRAMPNANRLAVAMDVVKFLHTFIGTKFPKLREQFIVITEAAGEDFVREFGNGA